MSNTKREHVPEDTSSDRALPSSAESGAPTLWLLDVDGVLNAHAFKQGKQNAWPTVTHKRIQVGFPTYDLYVADGLVAFIKKMLGTGLADIKWATTWGDQANEFFAPAFDFPVLEVGARPIGSSDYQYKQRAAKKVAAGAQRLIWTDDDEIDSKTRSEIKAHSKSLGKKHLLISPSPKLGLLPMHCEQIEAFILNK